MGVRFTVKVTELVPNVKCEECDRVWDLGDEDDANDYYYGHDCEGEEV